MQYRKFGNLDGVEVSALGFGCMRLPVVSREEKDVIDEDRAVAMVRHAIDQGVNYIDTAYPYHEGQSERVVGKALKDGYREKVYLATKCPVWMLKKQEDFDQYLEEQLEKLGVEYVDFYLLHALNQQRFEEIVKKFDLISCMERAKAAGKIRHIGFSFHDDLEVFREIVDFYDWDFCQIQYNYADTEEQAGTAGLEYAASKGLGVVIMEPLRGGKLAVPAPHLAEVFPKEKKPAEWALDFLWNRPEVSVVLSGMSTEQQVEENLEYASRSHVGMLKEEDMEMYCRAGEIFNTMALVKCTRCEYCMPCPSGINIPEIFSIYNRTATDGKNAAKELYKAQETKADACIRCRRCEKVCPQHIGISAMMLEIQEEFQD